MSTSIMNDRLAERNSGISSFYVMELLRLAKQLEAQGKDIIHMEIGEPDFPTPPTIAEAGIKHIQTGEVKYTPAAGLPELRKKIADFYQQRYEVAVDEQRIFVTPGGFWRFFIGSWGQPLTRKKNC